MSKSTGTDTGGDLKKTMPSDTILLVCVVACIFSLTVANWIATELSKAQEDPSRLGFNGVNVLSSVVCVWCLQIMVEQLMVSSNKPWARIFQGLDQSQQRKVLVYLIEIIWGSLSFLALIAFVFRIYVLKKPDGCISAVVSMTQRIEPTYCTLEETQSKETESGLWTVSPGTDVTYISGQDANTLATLHKTCFVQNAYGLFAACAMVSGMYIYELAFLGSSMRKTLMVHHFSAFLVLVLLLEQPLSSATVLTCIPHVLLAALEQPTFIALTAYRLYPQAKNAHNKLFFLAWVSFGLFKLVACVVGSTFFAIYWDQFTTLFKTIYIVASFVLLFSQAYSTFAQYKVWKRIIKKRLSPEGVAHEKSPEVSFESVQTSSVELPQDTV